MRVYRLCNKHEAESILKNRKFKNIGHKCQNDSTKNTHQYIQDIKAEVWYENKKISNTRI